MCISRNFRACILRVCVGVNVSPGVSGFCGESVSVSVSVSIPARMCVCVGCQVPAACVAQVPLAPCGPLLQDGNCLAEPEPLLGGGVSGAPAAHLPCRGLLCHGRGCPQVRGPLSSAGAWTPPSAPPWSTSLQELLVTLQPLYSLEGEGAQGAPEGCGV